MRWGYLLFAKNRYVDFKGLSGLRVHQRLGLKALQGFLAPKLSMTPPKETRETEGVDVVAPGFANVCQEF